MVTEYQEKKAEKLYPIGTEFISPYSGDRFTCKKTPEIYGNSITAGGNYIFYKGNGEWAEILSNPTVEIIKKW